MASQMETITAAFEPIVEYVRTFDVRNAITHQYPLTPYITVTAYLAFVFVGPKVMGKEKRDWLVPLLKLWNLSLAIFSAAVLVPWFAIVGKFALERGPFEALCMPGQELWAPGSMAAFICYVFMWSKFAELIDTVFLVCRGKDVIGLHWYHHATVLIYCWIGLNAQVGFAMWFGVINSFIHSIMYTYYYLAAVRSQPPSWGKYLTQMQMAQMLIGMAICGGWIYFWQQGRNCPLAGDIDPRVIVALTLVMYASYFYLFLQMYLKKQREAAKRRQERLLAAKAEQVSAKKQD